MIEHIKEHIGVDCDLSFIGLARAITIFSDKFKFIPKSLCLEVGVDSIFVAMDIREVKAQFALEKFWFYCDRDFPEYYWQISGYKDDDYSKKYIVYSNGV